MMNIDKTIFKEYDIRGKYPTSINEDFALIFGKSYGSYIQKNYNGKTVIVSRDNRLSSESICNNLIKGLLSTGLNVYDYGLITTPMNYYARYLENLPGIMITASHNPSDDNGFKFSFAGMINAKGDEIRDLLDFTLKGEFLTGNGTVTNKDITDKYLEYMQRNIKISSNKPKIVLDCANGITGIIARKVFSLFNLDFEIINEELDGNYPNHHPDPTIESNLTQLKNKMKEVNAKLGISFDGDGDRASFVDEFGEMLDLENYMIIMIQDLKNNISNKTILYDVKCSKFLEDKIKSYGLIPYEFRTGASYTHSEVIKKSIPFGAEYSSHIYFNDRDACLGSGIYASLRLIELISKSNKSLAKLNTEKNEYFSTNEIKVPTTNEKKFQIVERIKEFCLNKNYYVVSIDGVKVKFSDGWALVRASNTGPNITMRFEATTEIGLENLQNLFTKLVNELNK